MVMSEPGGASPAGSVATGAIPVQSAINPSRTMAAINAPDSDKANAITTTSCMPRQPRRRASHSDPAMSSAVSTSEAVASVGTINNGGPSTRIGPAPFEVSASRPVRPSEPRLVTPTRICCPAVGRKLLGTKVSTAVVPPTPLPRAIGSALLSMVCAAPRFPPLQYCSDIDCVR